MHYIGSKEKLLPFLHRHIEAEVKALHVSRFCDLFAGTGTVGNYFKNHASSVISNDAEYYSYVINRAYLTTTTLEGYEAQLQALEHLEPQHGFIATHYAIKRYYFSRENAMKIDAIRTQIQQWFENGTIDEERFMLLLATLLISVTYIANTASVFSAYLKTLKKTARTMLCLIPLHVTLSNQKHHVYCDDANTLIKSVQGDILYLDPPYSLRQYGANYHLLNTIAHYTPFEPKGKTGLPEYYSSPYSRQKDAAYALENLLSHANFKHIFLSYSSEGIISNDAITQIMEPLGVYKQASIDHKRFNAKNPRHHSHKTIEYLHILTKK